MALPSETFASPQDLSERRRLTDQAFQTLSDAFEDWKTLGVNDPLILDAVKTITTRHANLPVFRAKVDANENAFDYGLRELQPVSAAGLALVRQTGYVIDDFDLARGIDGFHALMQTNDAALMEKILGGAYLQSGRLDEQHYAMVVPAQNLRIIYEPSLRQNLPSAFAMLTMRF